MVEEGLKSIPADSSYAHVIRDVLAWHVAHPDDWRKTWRLLEDKWDRGDVCPEGALAPFNIDAKINGAYVALGLLYGNGDFAKTLEVATRSGQDSDCNPSSAAGVLGVILGYDKIPDEYRSGIPALADTRFEFTRYSFSEIVASTLARAEKVVASAGGRVTPTEVAIPLQAPEAPPLEQWDSGVPVARVSPDDETWQWKGQWKTRTLTNESSEWRAREAGAPGDEATFTFEGTGVALVGTMSQEGGRADVWVDGVKADPGVEAWVPERTNDSDYWHVTGLVPGPHRLRLVVRKDADERSTGRQVQIEAAVVYGEGPGRP